MKMIVNGGQGNTWSKALKPGHRAKDDDDSQKSLSARDSRESKSESMNKVSRSREKKSES